MKRVALLLCLALVVFALAACGAKAHVHEYSKDWSSDSAGHWQEAVCDCENAEPVKADHVDKNNDGACDICEFTDHTHTYADTWTADGEYHWHAANCGHIVEGADKAAHSDENGDGECDVCYVVVENVHKHIFAEEWSFDKEYHWHDTLCEHCSETADKAAHELDAAGYCKVCDNVINEIDMTSVEAVLLATLAREHMVNGGKVVFRHDLYDGGINDLVRSGYLYNDVYFVLGNGCSYFNYITVYDDNGATPNVSLQYWTQLIDPETESVFCAGSEDGGATILPYSGDSDKLYGYNYTPGYLLQKFDESNTLSKALYNMFQISKESTASNVVAKYDAETNVYSFSYEYLYINATAGDSSLGGSGDGNSGTGSQISYATEYYIVSVQFTLDDNMVIENAEFVVDTYRSEDFDPDFEYNPATGAVTWNDTYNPARYSFKVSQTSGERTYTLPYTKETLVPTSFDIMYKGKVVEDSITINPASLPANDRFIYFQAGNLYPATANTNFITQMTVTAINAATGEEIYPLNNNRGFGIYGGNPGTYKLTISMNDFSKTITIVVSTSAPTAIDPYIFYTATGDGTQWLEVDTKKDSAPDSGPKYSATIGVGEELLFTALIDPTSCAQTFSVTCSNANAIISDKVLTEAIVFGESISEENENTYTAKSFKANVAGTYRIIIKSIENPEVTTTLTVTVR